MGALELGEAFRRGEQADEAQVAGAALLMLATANSAVAAVDRLKERGARDLRFVCLLAAPEGTWATRAEGSSDSIPSRKPTPARRIGARTSFLPAMCSTS
jgi:hypothetical protein